MPFAASACRFLGISAKISLGVMQTTPLGGGFGFFLGQRTWHCQERPVVRIVERARGVAPGTEPDGLNPAGSAPEALEERAGELGPAPALLVLEVRVDALPAPRLPHPRRPGIEVGGAIVRAAEAQVAEGRRRHD